MPTPGALREDASTTAQIRLMDPNIISPTFEQREANRRYWGFDDVLSVDRYEIDGQLQDTVIGVRELRPDKFGLARSFLGRPAHHLHARLRQRCRARQPPQRRRRTQLPAVRRAG